MPEDKSPSSNCLKVFHILSNPCIGGIEGMLSELIPRIDKSRCDMRVVNMRSESMAYGLWDKTNVHYHRLKTPGKLLFDSVLGLAKLLKKEHVDVVEIYGLRANIIARLAARLAGVPVILTGVLNTDDWRKWYHIWLDRATSWAVSGWIPNSKACMRSLVEREKYSPNRIKVIYDGINVNKWTKSGNTDIRHRIREEFGCSQEKILYVTVGNLRYQKGYPYLIEAIAKVLKLNQNLHFVFVGNGSMEEELKEKCRSLDIEQAVTFAGYRSDIKDLYDAADIAVLPSLYEGLPICLIEAMSMELPVISTTVSGIPELVEQKKTGILIPPKDIDSLVKAIIQLADDPQKRIQMGKAGRQRVCKIFSIDRMLNEILDYFQILLNKVEKKS